MSDKQIVKQEQERTGNQKYCTIAQMHYAAGAAGYFNNCRKFTRK